MFKDFQRVWTPVLLQRQLRRRPVALRIAGEPVVLFRNVTGGAAALWDPCPRRGVSLSLGRRTAAGTLAGDRHGWEFDEHGVWIGATGERTQATAFPVYEAGGLVWLYTGQAAGPLAPPHVPKALRAARANVFALEVSWKTHWTRCMENMLDNAHVPYVHRRTIGRLLHRELRPDSRMEVSWKATPTGFFIAGTQDDRRSVGVHEFNRPNGMVLYVDGPPGRIRIQVYCIPVDSLQTRLLVVGDFGRNNWLARLFVPVNRFIVLEDRAIVESSQPPEVPPPGVEQSVATDRGTLQFRKYYYDVLKDEVPAIPVSRKKVGY